MQAKIIGGREEKVRGEKKGIGLRPLLLVRKAYRRLVQTKIVITSRGKTVVLMKKVPVARGTVGVGELAGRQRQGCSLAISKGFQGRPRFKKNKSAT